MNVLALKSRLTNLFNKYGRDILLSSTGNIPGYTESFDTITSKKYWTNNTTHEVTYTQPAVTPRTVRVAEKVFKQDEINNTTVLASDRRFVIPSSVVLNSTDILTVDNKKYTIILPIKVYEIGTDIVAYEVHCRG